MKNRTAFNNHELASFCKQMAMILHAGISTYEGIALMCEDIEDNTNQRTLTSVHQYLNEGESLYQALSNSHAFPKYMLDMIQIGETAGRLEEVMTALGIHYERLHENNEDIKTALAYPCIMIIMMLLIVIVLITQVLPIFYRVFEQLGSTINGFSKSVLDIGIAMSTYSYVFVFIFAIFIMIGVYFGYHKNGKKKLYHIFTRIAMTKNIALKLALSRFSSGMSIALSSGLDIEYSLALAKQLVQHKELLKRIDNAQNMMEHTDIASSLVESNVLTGMYAQLIKIGYRTGGMDNILSEIAEKYNEETNERIHHLISIIEPTLVAILSIMVGLILLSIMLPLIGIMSSL